MASHKERIMEDLTPLYNKEFYLAYLCGEDVVLPIPDGNAERYLAYLCGMDVTIPDVPDGRTETYLAYKCGEDVVLPDPMYRIEFYLAKWCGIDCEVPEPLYRIEYWLAQLANSGELKTVTGNPISVSDALAKPAESLTIEILPQQSGSGDPSPDNVRHISGWSNVNVYREAQYDAGATPYATINLNGTVYGGSLDVTTGVLTVTHGIVDLGSLGWARRSRSPQVFYVSYDEASMELGKISTMSSALVCKPNTNSWDTIIAYGDFTVCIKNSVGGSPYIIVVDSTAQDATALATALDGVQLVYELATPQTVQLSPTTVQMLLGNNVLWADSGDSELQYWARR